MVDSRDGSEDSALISRRKFFRRIALAGAAAGVGLGAGESVLGIPRVGAAPSDQLVKVSSTDTTSDFLNPKIAPGTRITTSILFPSGNQQLQISVADEVMPATYVVWRNTSGTYLARNGRTGNDDYSGTDAATVINNALAALSSGGHIHLKDGTYTINSPIQILSSNTMVSASPAAVIQPGNATTDLIQIGNGSIGIGVVMLDGLNFQANPGFSQTTGICVRNRSVASYWLNRCRATFNPAGGTNHYPFDFYGTVFGDNPGSGYMTNCETGQCSGSAIHLNAAGGGAPIITGCNFIQYLVPTNSIILWDQPSGYPSIDGFILTNCGMVGGTTNTPHCIDFHGTATTNGVFRMTHCSISGSIGSVIYLAPPSSVNYPNLEIDQCFLGFGTAPLQIPSGGGTIGNLIMRDILATNNRTTNYVQSPSTLANCRFYDWRAYNTGSVFPNGTLTTPLSGNTIAVEYPATWKISGGSVSDISIAPWGSSSFTSVASSTTNPLILYLSPQTQVRLTYTVAPTITAIGE